MTPPIEHGFLTIAVISPKLRLADVPTNCAYLENAARRAAAEGALVCVFPELSLTGYSCADLFYQETLLDAALDGLQKMAPLTAELKIALIVGLPMRVHGKLYNTAAFLANGKINGVIPKTHLPNTSEFYENRWFTTGKRWNGTGVEIGGQTVPFGSDLLFHAKDFPECVIGIEICEDLWVAEPPSGRQALAGATLICNPSAGNELLGKAAYRRQLVVQQSARCLAAYAYTNSGPNESTTDVVFSGHSMIAENGALLAESERFSFDDNILLSQVDLHRLAHERRLHNTWFENDTADFRRIPFTLNTSEKTPAKFLRNISPTPFIPNDTARRNDTCLEIFSIQTTALTRRLQHVNASTLTIGISGGLDSTLAFLVAIEAFDRLKLDRKGIMAISMPGPGTSSRTKKNAQRLAESLGVTFREISIDAAFAQHLSDISHSAKEYDLTFENAQARERTQVLMDIAGQTGGFVLGTGDLSESALGWCTFNGDHMSMYHINIGVPKTLVRYLVSWAAQARYTGVIQEVLNDICATPVSPELLPPTASGAISQETENIIGPYELHDFFLYHFVRGGCNPKKILFLAEIAFAREYDTGVIRKWLKVFLKRFFSQQFKRSSMPDGPKVGTVALSPRGDWRMPSDVNVDLWIKCLD